MKIKSFLLLLASFLLPLTMVAQSALSFIERDKNFAAGNYALYPESNLPQLTPAPQGYTPFYISHYGRHGSRYLNDMKGFKIPYKTLHEADSLGKLSDIGKMALQEIRQYITDAEGRWGDLSEKGKEQQQQIAHRMLQNFPEVFSEGAYVDARSTIVTRCALSMGSFALQMVKEISDLQVSMFNSYSDMWYLNHQNKLRDAATSRRGQKAVDKMVMKYWHHNKKMGSLFNDSAYVRQHVDLLWLAYYLMKASFTQQNTERSGEPNRLQQFFASDDYYLFWKIENAWSYLQSGFCMLNGAKQPYLQSYLLGKIITEADSIIASNQHGASLRFGHETVLLPLVCLMGINGYDLQTDNLEELEQKGWWANNVFPMAGNLQIIFYRKNATDQHPLIKVLLNEKEATLPLPSDLAPYYRWSDFRDFYLRKVAEGESALSTAKR
jgi:hypothetical protein